MADPPDELLAVLVRHSMHRVLLETTVLHGLVLVGALQLALGHADFPDDSRQVVQEFLAAWHLQMLQLDPALGQFTVLGEDGYLFPEDRRQV